MPLAPTAEQERIVAAIEEQLSRLDTSAATLERIRQNLKRLRSAVLLAAVQGTLVAQCADDEPAAEAITRVKARTRFRGTQEPLDSSMGPLPPGWAWARVGKLAARVTVGHVGPTKGNTYPKVCNSCDLRMFGRTTLTLRGSYIFRRISIELWPSRFYHQVM